MKEENMMKRTTKKECPYCFDKRVFSTGATPPEFSRVEPNGIIPRSKNLIYECENCKEFFILIIEE